MFKEASWLPQLAQSVMLKDIRGLRKDQLEINQPIFFIGQETSRAEAVKAKYDRTGSQSATQMSFQI